jgi:transcriptional antiterminator RfaH
MSSPKKHLTCVCRVCGRPCSVGAQRCRECSHPIGMPPKPAGASRVDVSPWEDLARRLAPALHQRGRLMDGGPYWCAARTEPNREPVAVHFLGLAGYDTYLPRVRERRSRNGRRIVSTPPLFPSYLFVRIEEGRWWTARWSIGIAALVSTSGSTPAKIADRVIDELKGREKGGWVELPEAPRFRPGEPVRVTGGLLMGASGLFAGMRGHERVAVLLACLGRVEMSAIDVAPV